MSDLRLPLLPVRAIFCLFRWTDCPLHVTRPVCPEAYLRDLRAQGPLPSGFCGGYSGSGQQRGSGVGNRCRSALPPTLRPQGWGAAPPGADRRSGPTSPQKTWSRGFLTCLPFPLKLQVECFTLNRPPLHNHFLNTSSLCLLRGPLFPWFFSLPTWSSLLILQHQPCFCPRVIDLLFLLPRLTGICRDLSPDFLSKMAREFLRFHSRSFYFCPNSHFLPRHFPSALDSLHPNIHFPIFTSFPSAPDSLHPNSHFLPRHSGFSISQYSLPSPALRIPYIPDYFSMEEHRNDWERKWVTVL